MTDWHDMTDESTGPIEVWLNSRDDRPSISCIVVHEDESTATIDVDSPSMRGAQAEVTGHFIGQGYEPIGEWRIEQDLVNQGRRHPVVTVRSFNPSLPATGDQENSGPKRALLIQ